MNINVSCEKCGDRLEAIREWSERGDIEVTVMPCGCLHPTVDGKLREDIDEEFVTEACRLWRVLYGGEVAIYQAAEFFASRVPKQKAKVLRFIARNALRLSIALGELAEDHEHKT